MPLIVTKITRHAVSGDVLRKCPTASTHRHLLRPVTSGLTSSSSAAVGMPRTGELRQTLLPSLPHQLLTVCASPDRPACSCSWPDRIALVDVDPVSRDRWSTRFGYARVPIAVFKNLQVFHALLLKLSCSLALLTISGFSGNPVLRSLNS